MERLEGGRQGLNRQKDGKEVGWMEEYQTVQKEVWIKEEMLSRLVDESGWMEGY